MGQPRPGEPMPPLHLRLPSGTNWRTDAARPEALSLIAIYRGGWCDDCRRFLRTLDEAIPQLRALGVAAMAASVDDEQTTQATATAWDITQLPLAGRLEIDQARSWGLYATRLTMQGADRHFIEPGLFLLRPDHSLYALWIATLPSARPEVAWLVETIAYLAERGFPLRGAD